MDSHICIEDNKYHIHKHRTSVITVLALGGTEVMLINSHLNSKFPMNASLVAQRVKRLPAMQETCVQSLS